MYYTAVNETFKFHLTHTDGGARKGKISTAHGVVDTPAFMPVGTRGSVRAMTPRDLCDVGAELVLANTYHLFLRPGDDRICRMGGLHKFMAWSGPLLTDSGGFQVFSFGKRLSVDIDEDGVSFRSHLDGSKHRLTPDDATDIQVRLGADIAMMFDECTAFPVSSGEARVSMERTLRWARRSRERFLKWKVAPASLPGTMTTPTQAQFGIIQGGVFPSLREFSARETIAMDFDGYAIGGLSVGEPSGVMRNVVSQTAMLLPVGRPRYLMGVGMPNDLVDAVASGVDLFDCVLPTRNARNGQLFTRFGPISIKAAVHADDDGPPETGCSCYTCQNFSRAYLRHLYLSNEISAATLNTIHNLHFYLDTMRRMREAIAFGSFDKFRLAFQRTYTRRSKQEFQGE